MYSKSNQTGRAPWWILGVGCLFLPTCPIAYATDLPLVTHSETWRYHKGTVAPQSNWKTVADAGLDATWLSGKGGFGYSDSTSELGLCQTVLADMKSKYVTFYFRKAFQISTPPSADFHLFLTADFDDGFIAWLDGKYLASKNSPGQGTEPNFNEVATAKHESSLGDSSRHPASRFDLGSIGSKLTAGSHVLAIMGLNQGAASSDFVQAFELGLGLPPTNCVSGLISTDTTWPFTNSPIVVCGAVTIADGATLTIEPGVRILFETDVGLTVANGGKLLAEGTADAPIQFAHKTGDANWDNITIQGSVGSPESRIAHAHFEGNAASTSKPCIVVDAGTVDLGYLTFANTGAPYIHVDGASFVIRNCIFPAATQGFEPVHGTQGVRSDGHGIFLRNFFGTPIGYNDVVDFTGGNRPSPIVHFINNVIEGSQDDGFDIDGTDAWIEGNIFLHVHRNNGTPDSSAAVSGGNDSTRTSHITILRNYFFDCDNAATAKQGNFYVMANNTVVHTSRVGGVDGASGVINVRDTTPSPTTFAKGYYVEGNIAVDAEQVVRNYDGSATSVTLVNNFIPQAWNGPGSGNQLTDPMLTRIPVVAETRFRTWEDAQMLKDWFTLQEASPAIGVGPNGADAGSSVKLGVTLRRIASVPENPRIAEFFVGPHWASPKAPSDGWPTGAGYTHYRWRLNGGGWSSETAISNPISLNAIADGKNRLEVIGRLDSGLYQNDPRFYEDGSTTSVEWTVGVAPRISLIATTEPGVVELSFEAFGGAAYALQFRDSLEVGSWQTLVSIPSQATAHTVLQTDQFSPSIPVRFYRIIQQ
jgi:hypothetical protein